MPILLDDFNCWSEDVKPSFIDDLEFYCGSSVFEDPAPSAMTIAVSSASPDVVAPVAPELWKTFETDEDLFMSMSPPNPLGFEEIPCVDVDFDENDGQTSDPLVSASLFGNDVLFHDCMWAGHCAGSEHEAGARTSKRSLPTLSGESAPAVGSPAKGVVSGCCKSGTDRTAKPVPLPTLSATISTTTSSSSSSSSTNSNNSSSNSNNSSSNTATVRMLSNGCGQPTTCTTSVVKTIEVPVVSGGPVRRTGVIVQKTFGRSLLIKSRTKCENNNVSVTKCANSSNSSNSGNSLLKVKSVDPVISQAIASNNNNNNNNVINNSLNDNIINSVQPVSFVPAPVAVSGSRPETPQSLSESEDDSCQLDLTSVLYNLDNLKPPQGDLWDDVLAAVEQEQANGIEIPPVLCTEDEPTEVVTKVENVFDQPKEEVDDEYDEDDDDDDDEDEEEEEEEEEEEDDYDDDLSDSSVRLDDLPPSPVTTNSSPVKAFPNSGAPAFSKNAIAAATTVVSDHTYDKRAWIRLDDLGVQTPSDSEEEVDVVSLYKQQSRSLSRSSSGSTDASSPGLPTNPSAKDQEQLQEITASKLLSASKAVSKRLRTKVGRGGKTYLKSGGKRRLSDADERLSKRARLHHYRPVKSRFATDSESDSKEKRDMHNNMERMRRIDLRNSFEELKGLVPSLANKERAPKVLILQDAAGYCTDLKIQSRQMAVQVAALRKEQERLRATVSGLRRSLAAHR